MTPPVTTDTASSAVVFLDGLGDRVRAVGGDGQPLEVLRLRPEFMDVAAFEFALRERAARIAGFRDPAFAPIVCVDRVSPLEHAVAVVSSRVGGRRLSALLVEVEARREALTFATAAGLLQQLVAAVARLHARAPDVGHGAIAPERLILDEQGRLVLVEHVLGAALEQLQWPRRRLWRELRVAMPPSAGAPRFDQRADLPQVGAVALALFAGRPLRDEDYPEGLTAVVHEVSERVARAEPTLAVGMSGWLVRALQIESRSFGSMKEAAAALDDVLAPVTRPALRAPGSGLRAASAVTQRDSRARLKPEAQRQKPVLVARSSSLVPSPIVNPERRAPSAEPRRVAPRSISNQQSPVSNGRNAPSWWSVLRVAFILVALGATTVAGTVRYLKNPPATAEAGIRPARPAARAAGRPARPSAAHTGAATGRTMLIDAELLDATGSAPVARARGWIAVTAPVDVEIAEQGRVLGVTRSGGLEVAPGWHEFEIANPTLGFRETRHLHVTAGGTTPLEIHLPFGLVDLNATPWAEVWLDGERLGETPIGSLSLPIGPHEFVFRHPELGERRQAVSIKVGEAARVSIDLARQ